MRALVLVALLLACTPAPFECVLDADCGADGKFCPDGGTMICRETECHCR